MASPPPSTGPGSDRIVTTARVRRMDVAVRAKRGAASPTEEARPKCRCTRAAAERGGVLPPARPGLTLVGGREERPHRDVAGQGREAEDPAPAEPDRPPRGR